MVLLLLGCWSLVTCDVVVVLPEDGAWISGTTLLSVDGQGQELRVSVDDQTVVSNRIEVEWDPSGFADGLHTLRADLINSRGATCSDEIQFGIDRVPPSSVGFAVAEDRGTLRFSSSPVDDVGIDRVEYTLDGAPVGDTISAESGEHVVTATAFDYAGNSVVEALTVDVDLPPTIEILAPEAGAEVGGVVSMSVLAADDERVVLFDVDVDGARAGTWTTGTTYDLDTCGLSWGLHTLTVTAEDPHGQRTSAEVEVTVVALDADHDGADACADCDDADPARFPGNPEVCGNGIDDDCDVDPAGCGPVGDLDAASPDAFLTTTADWGFTSDALLFTDLDEDGDDELIVGMSWAAAEAVGSGVVSLVDGLGSGDVLIDDRPAWLGAEDYGGAGTALAAGDLDGDGVIDIAVGNPTYHGPGHVYVVPAALAWGDLWLDDLPWRLDGLAERDAIGGALAAADLDGDGVDELLVGSEEARVGAGHGAVFVVGDGDPIDAGSAVVGSASNSWVGGAFCAGDFDGDGHPELLVGDWSGSPPGARVVRAARGSVVELDDAVGRILAPDGGIAGTTVGCGDLDGDGIADALVGDAFQVPGGAAWVNLGPITGSVNAGDPSWYAPAAASYVGSAFAIGDVDGGGADVIVGASDTPDDLGQTAGRLYVMLDPLDAPTLSDAGATVNGVATMVLGASIGAGDLDGDGFDEIASPVNAWGSSNAGVVIVRGGAGF